MGVKKPPHTHLIASHRRASYHRSMTQPINRYFQCADPLVRLREHAARLVRLQAILASELPPHLADACGVANLKGEELVIHAQGGAVAARLRQMVPSLLAAYAGHGVLLSGIKIRVEVRNPERPRPAVPHRAVSAQTRSGLAGLASSLPAGSPLAQALLRFVGQGGNRRSG